MKTIYFCSVYEYPTQEQLDKDIEADGKKHDYIVKADNRQTARTISSELFFRDTGKSIWTIEIEKLDRKQIDKYDVALMEETQHKLKAMGEVKKVML